MISIDYETVVPGFSKEEVRHGTFVRAHTGKVQFYVTNDGRARIRKLNIRAVLESYVGQEKPLLFQWEDPQVIEAIPSKGTELIEFEFWPYFPGLVSVALYVTDATNKAIMMKRKTDSNYQEAPIRWFFHVADDISLETLRALRKLVAGKGRRRSD